MPRPALGTIRSSRRGGLAGGNGWYAFGFVLPSLILVALIFLYPVYSLVRMSLFQSLGSLSLYVGLDNYAVVLDDQLFRTSVRNNLVLMIAVPVMIAVALGLALLLFEQRQAAPLYRFILFVPYIISITVSGIAFSQMLTKNGAFNQLLAAVGLGFLRRDWLGDPSLALLTVGGVIIWREAVLGIVLFSARLLTLPAEPLEAAMMDGANRWRAHWDVTLPQLHGIIGFYAITSIITIAVWTFSYVFVMTNGGPGNATMTADLYIYQNAFTVAQMNLAAAAATLVLLAAVAVVLVAGLLGRLRRSGAPA
ncbi:MAG: sugar ABC transporter permease [Thermomicrobiales bacterium]|nr:sugar ABC transporter permease [Thermomicrobiales bacterium]